MRPPGAGDGAAGADGAGGVGLGTTGEPQSMKELDSMVGSSLDQFFGDEKNWKKVGREITTTRKAPEAHRRQSVGLCRFRVQVPKPYPGVQYRRSKCLDDRHPRFAENGSEVSGRVEDNGEWLKVAEQIYLPMRVGTVRIMEPVPSEDGQAPPTVPPVESSSLNGFWSWLACCSGEKSSASHDSEVIVNPGGGDGVGQRSPAFRSSTSTRPAGSPSASAGMRGAGSGPSAFGAGPARAAPPAPGGLAGRAAEELEHARMKAEAEERAMCSREEEDPELPRPMPLPEDVSRNPLSNLDAANRHFSHPINPFSDAAGVGSMSPGKRRTEPRMQDETLQDPIKNVFQA